jgi:hypothetical protein
MEGFHQTVNSEVESARYTTVTYGPAGRSFGGSGAGHFDRSTLLRAQENWMQPLSIFMDEDQFQQ